MSALIAVEEQFSEPVKRLTRDLAKASSSMSKDEARFLVDRYYTHQDNRIRTENQIRSLIQAGEREPHETLAWFAEQDRMLESQVKLALKHWVSKQVVGKWLLSLMGIGEVIAAGLLANISLEEKVEDGFTHSFVRRQTCGQIWRYAGLDPTVRWLGRDKTAALARRCLIDEPSLNAESLVSLLSRELGRNPQRVLTRLRKANPRGFTVDQVVAEFSKRPWNAALKRITWLASEGFVKTQNRDDAFYGRIYAQRKESEIFNNESGKLASEAQRILGEKKIGKDTDAYFWYSGQLSAVDSRLYWQTDATERQGLAKRLAAKSKGPGLQMLPPAHIHARATRYARKLFISGLFEVMYFAQFGELPPMPYILTDRGGHADYMAPPNTHLIPNMDRALRQAGRSHQAKIEPIRIEEVK